MSGIKYCVVGEGEDFGVDRVHERLQVCAFEIGSANRASENSIANNSVARPCERDVAGRMTRYMENVQGFAAKDNGIAFIDEAVDFRRWIGLKAQGYDNACQALDPAYVGFVDGEWCAGFFFQRCDAPDVVKMSVRSNYFDDLDVVVFDEIQYGVGIVAGIYYNAFARFFTGEDVTIDLERTDDGGYKDHDVSWVIFTSSPVSWLR